MRRSKTPITVGWLCSLTRPLFLFPSAMPLESIHRQHLRNINLPDYLCCLFRSLILIGKEYVRNGRAFKIAIGAFQIEKINRRGCGDDQTIIHALTPLINCRCASIATAKDMDLVCYECTVYIFLISQRLGIRSRAIFTLVIKLGRVLVNYGYFVPLSRISSAFLLIYSLKRVIFWKTKSQALSQCISI